MLAVKDKKGFYVKFDTVGFMVNVKILIKLYCLDYDSRKSTKHLIQNNSQNTLKNNI